MMMEELRIGISSYRGLKEEKCEKRVIKLFQNLGGIL
jgi:hypothetical protein